jgi:hypothetical protein
VGTAIGFTCAVASTFLIAAMCEAWWDLHTEVSSGVDLRTIGLALGPVESYANMGYLVSFLWLPYAAGRAWWAGRNGVRIAARERALLTLVPMQIVVVQVLLRATLLRHNYPLPWWW